MLLPYSLILRILKDYESSPKEFSKMLEDRQVILSRCPAIKSTIKYFFQNKRGLFNSENVG